MCAKGNCRLRPMVSSPPHLLGTFLLSEEYQTFIYFVENQQSQKRLELMFGRQNKPQKLRVVMEYIPKEYILKDQLQTSFLYWMSSEQTPTIKMQTPCQPKQQRIQNEVGNSPRERRSIWGFIFMIEILFVSHQTHCERKKFYVTSKYFYLIFLFVVLCHNHIVLDRVTTLTNKFRCSAFLAVQFYECNNSLINIFSALVSCSRVKLDKHTFH